MFLFLTYSSFEIWLLFQRSLLFVGEIGEETKPAFECLRQFMGSPNLGFAFLRLGLPFATTIPKQVLLLSFAEKLFRTVCFGYEDAQTLPLQGS
jgi:hypothetical protein